LALGHPLSLQVEVVLEHIGPLKPVPELMAVAMAVGIVVVWKIDYLVSGSRCLGFPYDDFSLSPWDFPEATL